jgi:hypothetical protein
MGAVGRDWTRDHRPDPARPLRLSPVS